MKICTSSNLIFELLITSCQVNSIEDVYKSLQRIKQQITIKQ